MAKYDEIELLVRIGEYKTGGDAVADEAVAKIDQLRAYLRQGRDEFTGFDDGVARLGELVR